MSSDSYAWKSSAEPDPYFNQRYTTKQLARNERHASILAQLRRSTSAHVNVPEYLRGKASAPSEERDVLDTLSTQKSKLSQAKAKYM